MDNLDNCNWVIERYSKFDNKQWTPPTKNKILLSIQGAHLFLAQEGLALESLNLLKGPSVITTEHVNRTVVFYIHNEGKMSKFRVQFENINDANACVKIMKKYSNLKRNSSESAQSSNQQESLSAAVEKIMKKDNPNIPVVPAPDPSNSLESAIRLCILDPGFPQFVNEVEKILDSISNNF